MEHSSARSDGPLCAPHRALISFIDVAFSAAQSIDRDDKLTFMKRLVERKLQFPC